MDQFTEPLVTEPDHCVSDLDGNNAIYVFMVRDLRYFSRKFYFNKPRKRAAYAFVKFLLTIIKTFFADDVLTASGFDCGPSLFLLAHHSDPLLVVDHCNKLIHGYISSTVDSFHTHFNNLWRLLSQKSGVA